MNNADSISPTRVLLLVLVVAFAVEATIMLILATLDQPLRGGILLSLLDALALVAILAPVVWLLVVRPLRASASERVSLLSRMLTIQEEERASLARNLHDELGQAQTAVLLGARSIINATTLTEARERAEEVARMAASATEATRRLSRGLAPIVLIDFGLSVAVQRLCEDLATASGIAIACSGEIGSQRFDPSIEIAAYRLLQEAITNAIKHARASRIDVVLACNERELTIVVSDNGVGMSSSAARGGHGGLGLSGMRERMNLLNGSFHVETPTDHGTTVRARIPLPLRRDRA